MTSFSVYTETPKCEPEAADIRRAAQGDEHAIAYVCGSMKDYIAAIVRGEIGKSWSTEEDVDDAVIEIMLKMVRGLRRFVPGRPFRPWVGTIARNHVRTCNDSAAAKLRMRCVSIERPDDADCSAMGAIEAQLERAGAERGAPPNAYEVAVRNERHAQLHAAIEGLPVEMREVVEAYMRTENLRDVEEMLGISYPQARFLHHRALDLLRHRLDYQRTDGHGPGPQSGRHTPQAGGGPPPPP